MSIIFYDHLVNKTEVLDAIEKMDAPDNHKGKLKQLVDDIIHQGLIEFILQKLHPHHHHTFLTRVNDFPYDPEIIAYLRDHISEDIEKEIRAEADKLIHLIQKDLSTDKI
ncbi:hypothetical protein HYS10_00380 [Candidatus Collierbacteria bacterium]|nr:hypothetical protein [Candidatus Collierbacteria bacterium]